MTGYTVDKPARVCAATGRPLEVGERIHSALLEENGRFHRKDYAADAWTEAPTGAIAHWTAKLPPADAKVRQLVNEDILLECFDRLDGAEEQGRRNLRYVIALLLMRRKRLVFQDIEKAPEGEWLVLRERKSGRPCQVIDPGMDDAAMKAAQEELERILDA